MMVAYVDPRSGDCFPIEVPRWCGHAFAPLMLSPLPGLRREQIDWQERSLWRYRAAFPFAVEQPISLGEGCTPLIRRELYGGTVLFKCEWFMPTGSFKDRGASVMLSSLRAQGVTSVLEDSSGNGGAAIAAYAAAGGMTATIMAPSSTSPGKTVQMRAHGAAVVLVPGTRQATSDVAMHHEGEEFYASHNWHPFFLHGTKTLAYELWENLGFRAPDHVVIPCGAGSNVLGCSIGFAELLRAGQIDRIPKLWAAQPVHCSPVVAAVTEREPGPVLPTIAEGTAIAAPIRLVEVVDALKRSGGGAVAIEEKDIVAATKSLARMGLYVEPTCAQAAAAYRDLLETGQIGASETTVIVLTGTGLKATPRIAELLGVSA